MKSKRLFRPLQTQHGFSLVEMMVAVGISSIVVMTSMYIHYDLQRGLKQITDSVAKQQDNILFNQVVINYFRNAGPSFSTFYAPDDNNSNFFDLMTDQTSQGLTEPSRTVTLTLANRTDFHFVTKSNYGDKINRSSHLLQITNLYNNTPSANAGVSGTVAFNFNKLKTRLNTLNPTLVTPEEFLVFESTQQFRPIDNNVVVESAIPRSNSIVVRFRPASLAATTLVTTNFATGEGTPRNNHFWNFDNLADPDDNTYRNYSVLTGTFNGHVFTFTHALDKFFRLMPTTTGGPPTIVTYTVYLYRLYLVQTPDTSDDAAMADVYIERYRPETNSFSEEKLIMNNVKKIIFKRPRISVPQIDTLLE